MALFVLGDTPLSLGGSKPMDVFGGAWVDYVDKLRAGFQVVEETDTVVLCGDISWGMSLPEAKPDFQFLQELLPGRKILLKGNHDYWWETVSKMTRFFEAEGLENFEFLHNNCLCYRDIALCGTRGWFLDVEKGPHNEKMLRREVMRLEASLKAAGDREKICFLHYPPLLSGLPLSGDHRAADPIPGAALLLRPPPRRGAHARLLRGIIRGRRSLWFRGISPNFVPKQIPRRERQTQNGNKC